MKKIMFEFFIGDYGIITMLYDLIIDPFIRFFKYDFTIINFILFFLSLIGIISVLVVAIPTIIFFHFFGFIIDFKWIMTRT